MLTLLTKITIRRTFSFSCQTNLVVRANTHHGTMFYKQIYTITRYPNYFLILLMFWLKRSLTIVLIIRSAATHQTEHLATNLMLQSV